MRILKIELLILCFLFFPKILSAQSDNKIFYGEKHIIHSEIIGEDKEYWVHLPMDYEKSSEKYPVMYITDGDEHFFLAAGITQFMSSQYITPELIVVAIFHKDRNHDLTPTHCSTYLNGVESDGAKVSGGGEKLLEFIEKELVAQIESNYRTAPYRILAGHSLGGLFCVYSYLSRSDLFNAFIAMDPALNWDNDFCERTLMALPDQAPNFKNKLYISSAHNAPQGKPDKGPFRKSQDSFYKELKTKQSSNSKLEYFEDEKHLTVPYRSLYAGLSYIFSDYYIFNNPAFVEEVPFIEEHYKRVSDLYGMAFTPPQGLIEMLGKYFLLDKNEYAKSIEFFKLNTANYPASARAYEYLAKAYKASGDEENAILNFKKSLELNPENTEIQKQLNDLQGY
jgi:predicted alpha/beta superfamily hydrolase